MRKMKWLGLLTALCMLCTGCGNADSTASSSAADADTQSSVAAPSGLNLVTLGDSISYGYGLDDPENERYSALLTGMLEQSDNRKWNDYNYAVVGDNSSDLVYRLETGKALRLPSADAVVVCIGANNILGVYTEFLQDTVYSYDIDFENATDEELAALQEQIMADMQDTETVMQELQTKIDENLVQLEADMEVIYTMIRDRNADAPIYVMNVYNPYRGEAESVLPGLDEGDEDFGDFVQIQLDRCNKILSDFVAEHDDLTAVDLAAAFAAVDPVPIIGAGDYGEDVEYLDPHPNADGQKLIADTLFAVMRGDT